MSSGQTIFAGVDLSSGRKPVTFAAMDEDLKILAIHQWGPSEAVACLKEYENTLLVAHASPPRSVDLKKMIAQAGFKPSSKAGTRQWMETDVQESFTLLCEHTLFSRRSMEGRIQRALILYEEGLQIPDPMDFFEEVTRHKVLQGVLPLENIPSAHEVDALMAAYVSWMYVNEPRQVQVTGNKVLPTKKLPE